MRWPPPTSDTIDADEAALREQGYVVIEDLLSDDELREVRRLLAPELARDLHGRNDFEGHRTQRVYALVSRGRLFEDLVRHPRILAICDRFLAENYLLTASQAICIHPGETPQALHADDTFYPIPRPREPISMSSIWAIDPFTKENGATQVIPGSHRWSDERLQGVFDRVDFSSDPEGHPIAEAERREEPAWLDQLRTVEMPAGSAIVFMGTLLHRGGADTGSRSRLALSNQYCEPWARQQENFALGIAPERLREMHESVRRLLGFSIHPPFMGHFGGVHPERVIEAYDRKPR